MRAIDRYLSQNFDWFLRIGRGDSECFVCIEGDKVLAVLLSSNSSSVVLCFSD